MTDGSFAASYAYEPYGAATISGDPVGYPFTYTGREDDGTGLYDYRARYYSPEYGRFISEDSIGFAGGLNFYAYGGGNPVSFTDPTGFQIAVPVPLPAIVLRPIPFPIDPVLPVPDYFRPDLTDEDNEFCRKERRACAKLCEEVMDDPDGCNVYGGSIEKCIRGCLPFICGGNRV